MWHLAVDMPYWIHLVWMGLWVESLEHRHLLISEEVKSLGLYIYVVYLVVCLCTFYVHVHGRYMNTERSNELIDRCLLEHGDEYYDQKINQRVLYSKLALRYIPCSAHRQGRTDKRTQSNPINT